MSAPCLTAALIAAISWTATPLAAQWTSGRPDGHAPIGVMGDHRHEAGEIMFSYRFMYMNMDESLDGTTTVADADIIDPAGPYGFSVTPTKMPMMMHMFGFMYAPTNWLTLLAMLPAVTQDMDHITRMGGTRDEPAFTTTSGGIGDLSVGGLVKLAAWGNQAAHANLGVRAPTGSIEERDVLPTSMGQPVQLPYPMQTGSGTWDVDAGVTYLGQTGDWSWGGQGRGLFRTGTNDRGYRLGNKYLLTFWGARMLARNVSVSLRGEAQAWENITGADTALNQSLVPTARPDLRGGQRIDLGPGVNVDVRDGTFSGLRFAAEGLLPVYQSLDGPQLKNKWTLIVGTQWAFF